MSTTETETTGDRQSQSSRVYGWAIGALILVLLCVLSDAPAYRVMRDWQGDLMPHGSWWVAYAPVDYLIDSTPFSRPLMWWAEVWDVGGQFELAAVMRTPDMYDELYEELYGDDYQDEIQAIRNGLSTH